MKKLNYKKTISLTILTAMAVFIFPAPILAQSNNAPATKRSATAICSRVLNFGQKTAQTLSERQQRLLNHRSEVEATLNERLIKRTERLSDLREKNSSVRERHYQKLTELSQNEEQKKAIADFQAAVETAVRIRQEAFDSAKNTFRKSVEQALTDRKAATDMAISGLINLINSAVEKAKNDCESGVVLATIKQNIQNDVKEAREKFSADKRAINTLADLNAPREARKEAMTKAMNDFKTALENARTALKSVIGKQNNNLAPATPSVPATQ